MLSDGLVADFYQDKIYFKGKAYPIGSFTVELLNDFYDNDTGARFAVFSSNIHWIKRNIQAGFLYEDDCRKVKDEIYHLLKAAKHVKPFNMFDLNKEWEFIDALFSKAIFQSIKDFFKLKASFVENNDKVIDLEFKSVRMEDREALKSGEELITRFSETLDFYENLAADYSTAFGMFVEYEKRLNESKKCDETFLASTAMEIHQSKFRSRVGVGSRAEFERKIHPEIEYLAIKRSGLSKKLITARRMHCKRFIDFILADFYEGICKGHYPKKCLVCGRYFLMQNARKQLYCNGRDPNDDKNRTCRQVAADRRRGIREKENRKNNPIKFIYNRAAANIRQYAKRGKLSPQQSSAAKKYIKNMQFKAMQDNDFFNLEYEKQMSIKAIMKEAKK